MSILQRVRDWRLERRIKALSVQVYDALVAHEKAAARRIDAVRMELIRSRSPGQVARMEARMDFNMRRTIKRRLMGAFLSGRIPSSIVTAVFRLLRLRSL